MPDLPVALELLEPLMSRALLTGTAVNEATGQAMHAFSRNRVGDRR